MEVSARSIAALNAYDGRPFQVTDAEREDIMHLARIAQDRGLALEERVRALRVLRAKPEAPRITRESAAAALERLGVLD